jgi:hypothetical protein
MMARRGPAFGINTAENTPPVLMDSCMMESSFRNELATEMKFSSENHAVSPIAECLLNEKNMMDAGDRKPGSPAHGVMDSEGPEV